VRNFHQHRITGGMAQNIVNLLEMIDIQQIRQSGLFLRASRLASVCAILLHHVEERAAVIQPVSGSRTA
jgi:hypothetical protein